MVAGGKAASNHRPVCCEAISSMGVTLNGVHLLGARGNPVPSQPDDGGVCRFFDFVEKATYPTPKLWHAAACVFRLAQAMLTAGDTCRGGAPSRVSPVGVCGNQVPAHSPFWWGLQKRACGAIPLSSFGIRMPNKPFCPFAQMDKVQASGNSQWS
jgi:hypothetical protein